MCKKSYLLTFFFIFPSIKIIRQQSKQRAEIIKDQHIINGWMSPGHEGLVKFIRGREEDSQQPGKPISFFVVIEEVKIRQGKQAVADHMSCFLDDIIPIQKTGQVIGRPG